MINTIWFYTEQNLPQPRQVPNYLKKILKMVHNFLHGSASAYFYRN